MLSRAKNAQINLYSQKNGKAETHIKLYMPCNVLLHGAFKLPKTPFTYTPVVNFAH